MALVITPRGSWKDAMRAGQGRVRLWTGRELRWTRWCLMWRSPASVVRRYPSGRVSGIRIAWSIDHSATSVRWVESGNRKLGVQEVNTRAGRACE